jgi:hypothetical protein
MDLYNPCIVGRHYLTLIADHEKFDAKNQKFHQVGLVEHLNPDPESPHFTMYRHLRNFANPENIPIVHEKYMFGKIRSMRNSYRAHLLKILKTVQNPKKFSAREEEKILRAWKKFLARNIEPGPQGRKAAEILDRKLRRLPQFHRFTWESGFLKTMEEYGAWSKNIGPFLEKARPYQQIKIGYIGNLRKFLHPAI